MGRSLLRIVVTLGVAVAVLALILGSINLARLDPALMRQQPTMPPLVMPTFTPTPVQPTLPPSPSPTPVPTEPLPSPLLRACQIPALWVPYRVQAQDSLWSLAWREGLSVAFLVHANCLPVPFVRLGQIPAAASRCHPHAGPLHLWPPADLAHLLRPAGRDHVPPGLALRRHPGGHPHSQLLERQHPVRRSGALPPPLSGDDGHATAHGHPAAHGYLHARAPADQYRYADGHRHARAIAHAYAGAFPDRDGYARAIADAGAHGHAGAHRHADRRNPLA